MRKYLVQILRIAWEGGPMKIILAYYDRIRSIILDLTLYKPDHMIRQKQHFRLKIHNLNEPSDSALCIPNSGHTMH